MKLIIGLVLLIAIASAQIKSQDGTCDGIKWDAYTAADCTNPMQDLIAGFMVLGATAGACKDAKGIKMMADAQVKVLGDICGEYYLRILLILFSRY